MFSPQIIRAATAAGLALVAFAAPAAQPAADEASQIVVRNVDLSPDTNKQAVRLLAKLGEGAMEACGASYFSVQPHRQAVRSSECWQTSMTDVVQRIDNPRLTAAFQGRGMPQVTTSPGETAGGR